MGTTLEKRIEALEVAAPQERDPICIVRLIALPGQIDAEAVRAEVGGVVMLRADGESEDAFLDRVKAQAVQQAKPGCVAVALVFPAELPQ